jgi:hypothetical protein
VRNGCVQIGRFKFPARTFDLILSWRSIKNKRKGAAGLIKLCRMGVQFGGGSMDSLRAANDRPGLKNSFLLLVKQKRLAGFQ